MKKFILVLIAIGFSIGLKAQTEMARVSKETKRINEKIDQAMQHWKQYPMSDFPDIGEIIQNEITTSINRKLGIVSVTDLNEYIKRSTSSLPKPNWRKLSPINPVKD